MNYFFCIRVRAWDELSDALGSLFLRNSKFSHAFRNAIVRLLDTETDWQDRSGAVFLVRTPLRAST